MAGILVNRSVPQVVQEANVYINGKGYLGVTKKLKLPVIEFETIEAKSALSTNYSTGILKATDIEFTVSKVDKNQFLAIGLNSWTNRVPFLFKASIHQSGKAKDIPLSLAITGDIISWEMSDLEAGKEIEITIKMSAHFIDLNVDSVPMILKDSENMICIVGGVDYLASVRSNLGE